MHLTLLLTAAISAQPATSPRIELLTMGWGPLLDMRYGHATLCVVYERGPTRSYCLNYGATTAKSVDELAWSFIRGTARFEVVAQDYQDMMDLYRRDDRSIWVQRLPFTPKQVNEMIRRLTNDLSEENRFYTYHHIDDNCSTRLRDHISAVAGGALRRGGKRGIGVTYREIGRRGLADKPLFFFFMNVFLGRRLDGEATAWHSMALPAYLRKEVHRKLGAKPIMVYKRTGPTPPEKGGWGFGWIVLITLLLVLPVGITRYFGRYEKWALWFSTVPPSLLGAAVWFLALVTAMPEARYNEALLVLWPTDFLMALFGERRQQWYARIRVGWLMLVSVLLAMGVLIQPLLAILIAPALTAFAVLRLRADRSEGPKKKRKKGRP